MDVFRVARDVSVQLFAERCEGVGYLMLRRLPGRGGFWQPVTGAPQASENDRDAAVREVLEETGYDVSDSLRELGVRYTYRLDPARRARWDQVFGPDTAEITVVCFAADVGGQGDPVLDGSEHDAMAWCTEAEVFALLDWPVEADALDGRRRALAAVAAGLGRGRRA